MPPKRGHGIKRVHDFSARADGEVGRKSLRKTPGWIGLRRGRSNWREVQVRAKILQGRWEAGRIHRGVWTDSSVVHRPRSAGFRMGASCHHSKASRRPPYPGFQAGRFNTGVPGAAFIQQPPDPAAVRPKRTPVHGQRTGTVAGWTRLVKADQRSDELSPNGTSTRPGNRRGRAAPDPTG